MLVEADTALGGTGREIMLDAVTFEYRHAAVIAPDGQSDSKRAPGVFGAISDVFREVDGVGGFVELTTGHFEDV